jgi:hypothetical protein
VSTSAAGFWTQHGTHTLLVLVPALLFAGIGLAADFRVWLRRGGHRMPLAGAGSMLIAAGLSAVAALIHVAVCPEHFRIGVLYGVFFAVAAGGQFGWSVLVVTRRADWLAPVGLVANAAIVLLWVVTRTVGIPLGPAAGQVDAVGAVDLLSAACEIGVVALCALAIRHHVHPWRKPRPSGYAARSSTV